MMEALTAIRLIGTDVKGLVVLGNRTRSLDLLWLD